MWTARSRKLDRLSNHSVTLSVLPEAADSLLKGLCCSGS